MTGRCDRDCTSGTAERSSVLRVPVSNVRMPRSHSTTSGLPCDTTYSALSNHSSTVLLKRGLSSTVEEWLLSAEYVVSHGNPDVVLCERGIRTFETGTRNTLDLSAVPLVQSLSHLPVIVDPSHATGHRDLVPSMALAAVAAGADGLLIEVHPSPDDALSDGPQSLTFEQFVLLMGDVRLLVLSLI